MKYYPLFISTIVLCAWSNTALATPDSSCNGSNISKTFDSGASWNFCWKTDTRQGLVLSQVKFKAPGNIERRILGEASLSQIEAVFDDGATDPMFVSTALGLGGDNLQTLTQQDCTGGQLHSENGRNVLCAKTKDMGYLYRYTSQRQTQVYQISTFSQVGPRNYEIRWRFYENGTIEPGVGLSGILSAIGESAEQHGWPAAANAAIATSFTDHYLWRLDFDLDSRHDDDFIEEISSIPSGNRLRKSKSVQQVDSETGKNLNPAHKTFWRIVDGSVSHTGLGNISYELVPHHYDQSLLSSPDQPWLEYDFYFTRYHSCEKYAADNTVSNCSQHVAQFTNNNESLTGEDIVVWYKQTNHYLPRSEDSNRISTRWSTFKLFPRDWHAQNPY